MKALEALTFGELQRHAVEVAHILPNIDKRERLVNKCVDTFLKRQTQFLHTQVPDNMTEEGKAVALEILKRGKA